MVPVSEVRFNAEGLIRIVYLIRLRTFRNKKCFVVFYLDFTMANDFVADDEWVNVEMEELQREIDESGVAKIDEFVRKKLQQWKSVEVNIAVTGVSGAGKSSFTNAIRE